MPVTTAFERLRLEDCKKLEANPDYIVSRRPVYTTLCDPVFKKLEKIFRDKTKKGPAPNNIFETQGRWGIFFAGTWIFRES